MMANIVCVVIGIIIGCLIFDYKLFKVMMQLRKVAASPKTDEMYRKGIEYSVNQIERMK